MTNPPVRILIAIVLLAAAAAVAMLGSPGRRGVTHTPSAAVPRVALHRLTLPAVGRIQDVIIAGGRLHVLDAFGGRVLVTDVAGDSLLFELGRPGSGPGEFLRPNGLAVSPTDGSIAVVDAAMLHVFSADGAHVNSVRPQYPCPAQDVTVAWADAALHLAGACMQAGTDTLFAVLWRASESGALTEVARQANYTLSGDWGSPFGARHAVAESEGRLAFGIGTRPCIDVISENGMPVHLCSESEQPFSSDPPPEFGAQGNPRHAALLKWPDPLPWYIDRAVADGAPLWLRLFHHDSVVARLATPDGGRDLFVAPLDTFIRCRAGYCFWKGEESADSTVIEYIRMSDYLGTTAATTLAAPSTSPRRAGGR